MRILFATTHKFIPELRGGMEVNTHELARELMSRGHAVGVLCGLAGIGLVGLSARLRIKTMGMRVPRDRGLGYPVWRGWNPVSAVAEVIASFQPDAIVIQGGADFLPLANACLASGRPVVCYLHTQDLLRLPDEIRANPNLHFVANSMFTATLHPEKVIRGIYRPLVRQADYAVETSRSSVVFVNPAVHKGLEVATDLATSRPDVSFLFVVNRRPSRASICDPSRPPNVRLVGPFSDMRKVYRHAKLLLAPSLWDETWGRVATEAHYSGIPVLASDRGGLPEAVGPGGLCIAASASSSEWRTALSEIWDDDARYRELSDAALHYSQRTEIDPSHIAGSFAGYLASLL